MVWLCLSEPFFSHISFMNKSFELLSKILSEISPVDWLVPVLLLLGIPTFSFIFYLYLYIKEKNSDLNLVYLLFATFCFLRPIDTWRSEERRVYPQFSAPLHQQDQVIFYDKDELIMVILSLVFLVSIIFVAGIVFLILKLVSKIKKSG